VLLFRGLDTPYREAYTADINHDDTAAALKAKLEATDSIRAVDVAISGAGTTVCSAGDGNRYPTPLTLVCRNSSSSETHARQRVVAVCGNLTPCVCFCWLHPI
jgi:hypothetical protein